MKLFAITVAHNEDFFLEKWINYYGREIGFENLFIIDHGSTDISVQKLRSIKSINFLTVPRYNYDEGQRVRAVSCLHESLLQYFDAGIVVDCDEFLVVDPKRFGNLRNFVSNVRDNGIMGATGLGLNVTHMPDIEGPYVPHIPILAQRRHAIFNLAMCKTSLSMTKTKWSGGFHASSLRPQFFDGFFLFHLKNFDRDWRLVRQATSRGWEWSGSYGGHARGPDSDVEQRYERFVAQRIKRETVDDFSFEKEIDRLNNIVNKTSANMFVFDRPKEPIDGNVRLIPAWAKCLF